MYMYVYSYVCVVAEELKLALSSLIAFHFVYWDSISINPEFTNTD